MTAASLEGKIALVTGGSSGIGKAICNALLDQNVTVVNADINEHSISSTPKNYFFKKVDAAYGEDIQQLYNFLKTKVGLPQILICNAGRGIHEKILEGDPEKWIQVLNNNIMSTLRPLRSLLPEMIEAGIPDVVFVSSVASYHAYEYGGIYAASKAAVNVIAETLRLELREKARVTVIAPGVVETNFFENMQSGFLDIEGIGYGAVSAAEVAEAVLFALTRNINHVINNIILRPVKQIF